MRHRKGGRATRAWLLALAVGACPLTALDAEPLVFETPEVGEPGALDGLSTAALVPAGLLNGGRDYYATLEVFTPVDSSSGPTLKVSGSVQEWCGQTSRS